MYLLAVFGCVVFYLAYQEWMSWLLLVGVLCLPVAALILSLPAMLSIRLQPACGSFLSVGEQEKVVLTANCKFPLPPCKGMIRARRITTGESFTVKNGSFLPTEHCGTLLCRAEKPRVCDYLGMFSLRVTQRPAIPVVVRPRPVMMLHLPELDRYMARAWKPKAGGGFAENHELRLYRPGDSMNQIHWKLSAKTGKYIVREAMEPVRDRILVTMELRGTPEELDRKFGRFLWLGGHLLRMGLIFETRVLTGKGIRVAQITDRKELFSVLDMLLSLPPAAEDEQLPEEIAGWQYRIGGGVDET